MGGSHWSNPKALTKLIDFYRKEGKIIPHSLVSLNHLKYVEFYRWNVPEIYITKPERVLLQAHFSDHKPTLRPFSHFPLKESL